MPKGHVNQTGISLCRTTEGYVLCAFDVDGFDVKRARSASDHAAKSNGDDGSQRYRNNAPNMTVEKDGSPNTAANEMCSKMPIQSIMRRPNGFINNAPASRSSMKIAPQVNMVRR